MVQKSLKTGSHSQPQFPNWVCSCGGGFSTNLLLICLFYFILFFCNRWAVSSVMTRQNQIPTEDGSRVTLALIPLWDMCNHTNGLVKISSWGWGWGLLSFWVHILLGSLFPCQLSPGQAEATLALPCLPLIEAGCLFILKTENSNLRALWETAATAFVWSEPQPQLSQSFLVSLDHRLNGPLCFLFSYK
jgi:hypothetical protein